MEQQIPQNRIESFARSVSQRLNDSANVSETQSDIAAEQKVLAELLMSAPVLEAAKLSLSKALNGLLPAKDAVSDEAITASVRGILRNRAADARRFAVMVLEPEFVELARELGAPDATKSPRLIPAKQQEVIERLVQEHDMRGAEPPVHVLAAALGHRLTHEALEHVFAPHGKLYHALFDGMRAALPTHSAEQCTQTVQAWLTARRNAAIAVTDTLKENGAAFVQAMARSEEILDAKHSKTSTSATSPSSRITTPAAMVTPALLTMHSTPNKSAIEIEWSKTPQQKGEDVAYTINHALACTATDFIDPFVGNWTQKKFGKRISIDAIDPSHGHDHAHGGHGLSWWIGEAAGDFGAIPVTIAAQRLFPGFMQGIKTILQPPLSGIFAHGARKGAERFAREKGLSVDDPQVKQKEKEIYQYEVDHLPQAFLWTASSIAINLATQKYVMKNDAPLWLMGLGKGLGATLSASVLVGARGLFPDMAHKSDSWISKTFIAPTSHAIGRIFGVEREVIDKNATHTGAVYHAR